MTGAIAHWDNTPSILAQHFGYEDGLAGRDRLPWPTWYFNPRLERAYRLGQSMAKHAGTAQER